ncbi:MAG: hypothetical protein ACYS0D_13385 [Planctomycetota bacterium]|jgi:CIC family chloride channel protein
MTSDTPKPQPEPPTPEPPAARRSKPRALSLARRLRRLSARLGFERNWYMIIVAAGIGVLTAAVAMAFMWTIRETEHAALSIPRAALWWVIALAPMGGAVLTGTITYYLAREARGHGVPSARSGPAARRGRRAPSSRSDRPWDRRPAVS